MNSTDKNEAIVLLPTNLTPNEQSNLIDKYEINQIEKMNKTGNSNAFWQNFKANQTTLNDKNFTIDSSEEKT